jgi:hypothetical protein
MIINLLLLLLLNYIILVSTVDIVNDSLIFPIKYDIKILSKRFLNQSYDISLKSLFCVISSKDYIVPISQPLSQSIYNTTNNNNELNLLRTLAIAAASNNLREVDIISLTYIEVSQHVNISNKLKLLIFDNYKYPTSYVELTNKEEKEILDNPILFKKWLLNRYGDTNIKFKSSKDNIELRWAHSKGNLKLLNSQSLINNRNSNNNHGIIHYSSPGHMFVFLSKVIKENVTNWKSINNQDFDNDFPIDRVVYYYITPTLHPSLQQLYFTFNENCTDNIQSFSNCNNATQKILIDYWTEQRYFDIFVNPWLTPSILPYNHVNNYNINSNNNVNNNNNNINVTNKFISSSYKDINIINNPYINKISNTNSTMYNHLTINTLNKFNSIYEIINQMKLNKRLNNNNLEINNNVINRYISWVIRDLPVELLNIVKSDYVAARLDSTKSFEESYISK